MKKSKIIIFSTALVLLLFANISVTLFDGSENEININLNKTEVFAHGVSEGSGSGDDSGCTAGGPGSSGCSYKAEVKGIASECSTSCNSGYYACCKLGWNLEATCTCKKE